MSNTSRSNVSSDTSAKNGSMVSISRANLNNGNGIQSGSTSTLISDKENTQNVLGCGAFQAFPNQIVFKDFEAPGNYKETISFRNNDNVSNTHEASSGGIGILGFSSNYDIRSKIKIFQSGTSQKKYHQHTCCSRS